MQYQMLNFDGAVPQESVPLKDNGDRLEANDPWMKVSKDSYFPNAYRYTDLLPNELGFNLQADVSLTFNTYIEQFRFDSGSQFGGSDDLNAPKRFQPRIGLGQDQEQAAQDISFDFKFYLESQDGTRQEVFLKNFWVNAVDLDTSMGNYDHEAFISFPNDGLAEYGTDESQDADVIYTLPEGNGATGEKGPLSGIDDSQGCNKWVDWVDWYPEKGIPKAL